MRSSLMLIAILVPAGCYLQAAEPEFKLPPNGSWTKYREVFRGTNGNEFAGTTTVRLLAGPTENGEATRWIEFDGVPSTNDNRFIEKFLMREATLLRSDAPIRDADRIWFREGMNLPQRFDRVSNTRVFLMRNYTLDHYLSFLPQTRKEWKSLPNRRVIEYQQGKLVCPAAVSGSLVTGFKSQVAPVRLEWTNECTVWHHKDIPFGIAAMKGSRSFVQVNEKGERSAPEPRGKFEVEVLDWGTGAESAFPDGQ